MAAAAAEKAVAYHTISIDSVSINFPFKPYDLQIDYMRKVLECVREGRNGLLESPTGTGKTLSLLCSSLAWLEQGKAASQLARLQAASGAGGPDNSSGDWNPPGPRHKIIFASRTHSQLSQAMGELAGTTYRYMKVAILGSRDQLCVNPAVMQANSSREKLNMCQARVKSRTCVYHQNVEKNKDKLELRDSQLMDIEDLHKLGKKLSFCPYYMSRERYKTADVIFMPYNYLLDHKTRKSLDLDLTGAVLIFDEAHNIQKLCEETASGSITLADIALAIKDIDDIVAELENPGVGFDENSDGGGSAKDINEAEIIGIKALLLEVERELGERMGKISALTLPGSYILDLFGPLRSGNHIHNIDLMVNYRSGTPDAGVSTKGRGLAKLEEILSVAFNEDIKQGDLQAFFKVHLSKEDKSEGGRGFLKSRSETITLNLWCFSPGFSMHRLSKLGARSIILTSGTLSPLAAFQEEIGIPFPVQLENKHIISASQVWCGVVCQGPDGTVLNSSFKCRSDPKYLTSLGQSVINIIRLVPHGVLIFFPSYSLLNSVREFWQNCGIWSRIEAIKAIFIEPQRKDALSVVMKDYYAMVKEGRGACFLAVCRGKVAEGLDFADENGRAVIITGLPYPPLKDPRVELKRSFLDEELRKSGRGTSALSMNGNKWYSLEAFRATNQAIGRVIRHSRDHGAIIFLDSRFGELSARQALSRWLQPFFHQHTQIGTAIKGLAGFFKTDSSLGQQRREVIRLQNELINAGKGVKRSRPQLCLEADDDAATDAQPGLVSTAQYSRQEAGDGMPRRPSAAVSIFSSSSSSSGISFNDSQSLQRPLRPADGQAATAGPARKKLRVVVKGFLSSATCDNAAADENSPHNKQTATTTNTSAAAASSSSSSVGEDPSQDKAKNYVSLLKKCLTTEEFTMFKQAIKYYRDVADFRTLRPVLEAVLLKYQVQHVNILPGFRVFLKKRHLAEFEAFCAKEALTKN